MVTTTPILLPDALSTLPSTRQRQDTVRLDDTHSLTTDGVRDPAQPAVTPTMTSSSA